MKSPLIKGNQGEPSFGAFSKQDASGSQIDKKNSQHKHSGTGTHEFKSEKDPSINANQTPK